ncbi:hypothetical protein H0W26_00400, partial [Candidatus Dependentiae bacterium]|nr:hypothetical protein [Candidatus Dependentiae bacterium]
MNILGKSFVGTILLISLFGVFISSAVLASENLIISKKSKSQANQRSNGPTCRPVGTSERKPSIPLTIANESKESISGVVPSSLMCDIISVTGAEPDLRLKGYHSLRGMLEQCLFSHEEDPGGLRGGWHRLWEEHLKAPENLICKKDIKKIVEDHLSCVIDESHEMFLSFTKMHRALNTYESNLCSFVSQPN